MRNILKIYKRDITKISTNFVALIIVLGLAILPSLYAWFNIKASWDPYSNTGEIPVAIVNLDSGTKFGDESINIGNDVVNELKKNTAIGWIFVDEKEAEYGLSHGNYYASITIPQDFSSNITSVVSDNPVKPKLIYAVNEKSNAVAPKITKSGATTLQGTITKSFLEMINGVIFSKFNDMGIELENNKSNLEKLRDIVLEINGNMDEIENTVNEFYNGALTLDELTKNLNSNLPVIEDSLTKAQSVASTATDLITNTEETVSEISPFVKNGLVFAKNISVEVGGLLQNNLSNLPADSGTLEILTTIENYLDILQTKLNSIADYLAKLGKIKPDLKELSDNLRALADKLNNDKALVNSLITSVSNGNTIAKDILDKLITDVNSITGFLNNKINNFDNVIEPSIKDALKNTLDICNNASSVLNQASQDFPKAKDLVALAMKGTDLGTTELAKFKDKLPEIRSSISKIASKLEKIDDSTVDSLIDLLKNDPDIVKTFMASPIELVENRVYPVPNYGSAMTPFFTALSLWVGALILCSILTVEVEPLVEGEELKSYEKYFGKYLTFLTIAVLQAIIVTLGDKYILGSYIADFKVFVLFGVFISVVFSIVVYTLVSVFGNIGKAIGVILLVLQISASGGTFPIQVTPPFFQGINPFLPFTYAIGGMRESVAGILWSSMKHDIMILSLFFIGSIIVGVVLKKPLHKINEKFEHKFKESGIGE